MGPHRPAAGDPFLMVGTGKGAFLLFPDSGGGWRLEAPLLPGWDIYHFTHDWRDGTLLVGASNPVHGPLVARSRDWGRNWDQDVEGLAYGDGDGRLDRVWHLRAGPDDQPGRLYAGVAEAGLFRSDDGGRRWESVGGLRRHPSREKWMPGGGGLCLHTILFDPRDSRTIYVAISAAGVYRSDDGGDSWTPCNRGVRAEFLPEQNPEVGQCVHKLVLDPENPDRLFQQNHCGVYRSDDRGDHWTEVSDGLPSTFGFPVGAHPRRGGTFFTVPLEADTRRFCPDGRLAVWRTGDAGDHWERFDRGLPGPNAWLVVLREAMAVDDADPCGVYFGTRTGALFGSSDEAESWHPIALHLPPIQSVEVGRVSDRWSG